MFTAASDCVTDTHKKVKAGGESEVKPEGSEQLAGELVRCVSEEAQGEGAGGSRPEALSSSASGLKEALGLSFQVSRMGWREHSGKFSPSSLCFRASLRFKSASEGRGYRKHSA